MEDNDNAQSDENYVSENFTAKLFSKLKRAHVQNQKHFQNSLFTLPTQFKPILRQYQYKTIQWLYHRERSKDIIPHLYREILAKDGETRVYKNLLHSIFHSLWPPPKDIDVPPGGILADEMGLGKTVEIIAIILLNKRLDHIPKEVFLDNDENIFPTKKKKLKLNETLFCLCCSKSKTHMIKCKKCNTWQHRRCVCSFDEEHNNNVNYPYICPKCWENEPQPIVSGATFIACPNSIRKQWLSEIRKHTSPPLRVHLYNGVLKKKWISPRQLADYDIILADYNVLKKEIYFTPENHLNMSLRRGPKRMRVNSPILMIEWWRVCLDEAQMVDLNQSMISKMVRKLPG